MTQCPICDDHSMTDGEHCAGCGYWVCTDCRTATDEQGEWFCDDCMAEMARSDINRHHGALS